MSKKENNESIVNIALSELKPFKDHPFSIRDDEAMQQTVESVREYGVLVPAISSVTGIVMMTSPAVRRRMATPRTESKQARMRLLIPAKTKRISRTCPI